MPPSPTRSPNNAPKDKRRRLSIDSRRHSPYFSSTSETRPPVSPIKAVACTPPRNLKRAPQRASPSVSPHFAPSPRPVSAGTNLDSHAPLQLIQESLAPDTWKVLIATCLVNKTRGAQAGPVCAEILRRWKTPDALAEADEEELATMLHSLGLHNRRAARLKAFSREYCDAPPSPTSLFPTRDPKAAYLGKTPVSHYVGVGRYAVESWVVFCSPDEEAWKRVRPTDKELRAYLERRWALEGVVMEQ